MKRTKIIKRVGRTYAFGKMRSGDIIELLELFQTKNIFMEVIKIETDSRFYKSIEEKQEENVIFSCPPIERYTDIFIPVCSREGLAERIDEIIDNDPEMLIFDLTNLSLEEFMRFLLRFLPSCLTGQVCCPGWTRSFVDCRIEIPVSKS